MKKGYVYILTNPSFKEDWVKIGKSSRPVDLRSRELDNTAVPLPFEVYATIETEKYEELEKQIHKTIDLLTELRIRQSREFFNISPEEALKLIENLIRTLDDAKIYRSDEYRKETPVALEVENRKKAPRFNFNMVDIPIGAKLVFVPEPSITVTVANDSQIEYQDRLYSLSPFAGTFMPVNLRNNSDSYQGAKFFTYNGNLLTDLRSKAEESVGCFVTDTLIDNEQEDDAQPEANTNNRSKSPRFKFSMVNISKGDKLVFTPNPKIEAVVISDNKIEYQGKEYTLSAFAKEFMPKPLQNDSQSYRGSNYFSYNGRILTDIRESLEGNTDDSSNSICLF